MRLRCATCSSGTVSRSNRRALRVAPRTTVTTSLSPEIAGSITRPELGGLGAIDLQMHLTGEDFAAACQTLARDFRGLSTAEIGLSFPIERHIRIRAGAQALSRTGGEIRCAKRSELADCPRLSRRNTRNRSRHCGRFARGGNDLCQRPSPKSKHRLPPPDPARKGRRSDFARHTAPILLSSVPWKQAHRLVHGRPSRQSGNRYCSRISHRRPELSDDPCLSRRCLGGRELCRSDGSQSN